MNLPALVAQRQGQGTESADNLNTLVQSGYVATQLRAFIGLPYMTVILTGIYAANDGLGGVFQWFNTTVAIDDNLNIIVPYGAQTGAWIRISIKANGPGPQYSSVRTITSDSVRSTDYSLWCNAAAGGFTVTLPTAAQNAGRRIETVKIDSTANQIVVSDGTSALALLTFTPSRGVYQSFVWETDGVIWRGV